ncbi:hypothetical protein [Limnohabitans curvus]|uniref:hypothetical protein n=1 Tax=Limnohabitans curvus TaxID=323423 RepID=UPI0011B2177D|nr:hypothetical protein [Limnohabitans curvus]
MEFLAILCGLGGFFITWKTYHWFWSLADLVHESGYSYFMKRAGMSVVVGLLGYVFTSPDFQSSSPVSPTNRGGSIDYIKSVNSNTLADESPPQEILINIPNSPQRDDADSNGASSDKGGDSVDYKDEPKTIKSDDLINQSVTPKE